MMGMPRGARVWLACGATDMRRGFDGRAALVQTQLAADPYAGHLLYPYAKARRIGQS
jgi:transposase